MDKRLETSNTIWGVVIGDINLLTWPISVLIFGPAAGTLGEDVRVLGYIGGIYLLGTEFNKLEIWVLDCACLFGGLRVSTTK